MLPVLQKYNFAALLARCDAQLASPGALTPDPASPGCIFKWLCLASSIGREELLQVCKARVGALADDDAGLASLLQALSRQSGVEELAACGQGAVAASILARAIPSHVSAHLWLHWLCLAARTPSLELLDVCTTKVMSLASVGEGLSQLLQTMSDPGVVDGLATAGQAHMVAAIVAKLGSGKVVQQQAECTHNGNGGKHAFRSPLRYGPACECPECMVTTRCYFCKYCAWCLKCTT